MTGEKSNARLVKGLEDSCAHALREVSFVRRKARIFTRQDGKGDLHWLGLVIETRREEGAVYLTPTIGFRNQEIHRIIAKVDGEAFHPYLPPTVALNIGYLSPEKSTLSLRVTCQSSAEEVAQELARRVDLDGNPFFSDTSLPWIIRQIPELSTWEDASERMLVALHLSGKSDSELRDFTSTRIRQGELTNPGSLETGIVTW